MTTLADLERAELEILGLLPRSSNHTFLVRLGAAAGGDEPDQRPLAVYKPQRGERPLWDVPDGTLCHREVAASLLAEALGWPNVPTTVLREGPLGLGMVQAFVPFDPEQHFFTLRDDAPDEMRRIALFDVIANNADRKGGHVLRALEGDIFVVDHGLCFLVEPKLRTVIWEHADEAVPAELLDDLRRVRADLADGGGLDGRLRELIDGEEVDALRERIDALLATPRYPMPGDERPYPWPLV